ncbi:hypothetical protein ACIQB5_51420 [Streptomyces sp. NPDC088560]|uniref:hypothetical protein n=1 Tax=Streptomyces sp. NPDC088560 TaxID=3365868 RepID=UPI0038103E1A
MNTLEMEELARAVTTATQGRTDIAIGGRFALRMMDLVPNRPSTDEVLEVYGSREAFSGIVGKLQNQGKINYYIEELTFTPHTKNGIRFLAVEDAVRLQMRDFSSSKNVPMAARDLAAMHQALGEHAIDTILATHPRGDQVSPACALILRSAAVTPKYSLDATAKRQLQQLGDGLDLFERSVTSAQHLESLATMKMEAEKLRQNADRAIRSKFRYFNGSDNKELLANRAGYAIWEESGKCKASMEQLRAAVVQRMGSFQWPERFRKSEMQVPLVSTGSHYEKIVAENLRHLPSYDAVPAVLPHYSHSAGHNEIEVTLEANNEVTFNGPPHLMHVAARAAAQLQQRATNSGSEDFPSPSTRRAPAQGGGVGPRQPRQR